MISLISLKVLIVCVISLKNITSLNSLDELKPIVSAKELFSSSVYLESAIPKDSLKSAYSFNKSRRMFLENNEAFSSKSLGTDFKAVLNESFTSKGMIADWALHDKGDGNPHTHILLTVREVDSKKHWMSKQKSVFANSRDKEGRPIYNPELQSYNPKDKEATSKYRIPKLDEYGNQKARIREGKGTEYLWEKVTIPSNDWNDRKNAEVWRESWTRHCNKYLDKENQIDHRSYERQGKDIIPSIHEGVTARKMEANGKIADRCQINRNIKELNQIREQLKEIVREITELITEKARAIYDRFKEFRRSVRDTERTGTDDRDTGKSADGNRNTDNRESEIERRTGRINEIERAVNNSIKETELTDREIKETDSRLSELKQLIKDKEERRNERFRKLKERRRTSNNAGGNAGSDRQSTKESGNRDLQKLREQQGDIRAFIRELSDEERTSKEKRDNKILERHDREAERKRLDSERKRRVEETEYDIRDKRVKCKERSR